MEVNQPAVEVIAPASAPPPRDLFRPTLRAQLPTILDHAPLTLRHPRHRAYVRIAAAALAGFRGTLHARGFTEIQTSKIVAAATESGATVFRLDDLGRPADLAQSPQFYKQIMVGVFERVFEVRPVFRAGYTVCRPAWPEATLGAVGDAGVEAAIRDTGLDSCVCAPLKARGHVFGAIVFAFGTSGRRYDERDRHTAKELARRAALALDNAHLFAATQAAVRLRDEFLAVAAHELKTPVTSLRGYAQLTIRQFERDGYLDPERTRRALAVIDSQAMRLTHLVSQLLDVSQLDAGRLRLDRRETDLVPLVEEVVRRVRCIADRHDIVLRAPARAIAVVDPTRVEQIVANLLNNAVKFSPTGSRLDVEIGAVPGDVVRLTVRDWGGGVRPERRARLFDRFYKAHDDFQGGLGLGFSISRQLALRHGGTLEAEVPPGGGTQFVLTLPVRGG